MVSVGMITVDVLDERAAASWWRDRLGSEYLAQYPGFVMLDLPGSPLRLAFQQVAEVTKGKNRIHLDLEASTDRSAEVTAFVDAGAQVLEEHRASEDFAWSVLRDPFGLVFCVSDPH